MASFENRVRTLRERGQDAGERAPAGEPTPTVRTPPTRPSSPPPKTYQPPRKLGRRILKWLALLFVVGVVVGAGGLATLFYVYGRDLPRMDNLSQYDPPTVTRLYGRGGELIAEYAEDEGFRTVLPFARIPKLVVDAVLSAEDADFRAHEGLDYLGMVRAFFVNLLHGRFKQGGSTITQQVVKTMILSHEKTIARKVKEVILARRLEQKLGKDEILALYLNQIYFGHRRHGIEEAARFYFGKTAEKLTLGEAAVIAGLIKSPGRFSPRLHPRASKARQREVLANLSKASAAGRLSRVYSPAEVQAAMDAPLVVWRPQEPWLGRAPYYADLVRRQVAEQLGEKNFFRKNLRIETSVDVRLQVAAENALRRGLLRLDQRTGFRGADENVTGPEREKLRRALSKEAGEVTAGDAYRAIVTEVGAQHAMVTLGALDAVLPASGATWATGGRRRARKRLGELLKVGDVIQVRVSSLSSPRGSHKGKLVVALEQVPEVQGAFVALDPFTREVVALVGGYDFAKSPFNRAVKAQRQPGSAFKPIVYSAAIRTQRYTPSTIVLDSPAVYGPIFSRYAYRPQNYDRQYRGEVRLRSALGQSLNLVAVKVADDIGIEAVRDEARRLGIQSPISKNLAVALGADSVTPMELANAYAVFASGGKLATPTLVRRIATADGKAVFAHVVAAKEVMTPAQAYVMTSLLRAPIEDPKGTARGAAKVGHLVAGKTGTTNKHVDTWFVGYTPTLLAAVWIGHDDRQPLGGRATGGHVAVPIWVDFMKAAMAGKPRSEFPRPGSIELARVDPRTGMRAAAGQVDAVEEVFVTGTAPKEEAPKPGVAATPDTLLLDDYQPSASPAPGAAPRPPGTLAAPIAPPSIVRPTTPAPLAAPQRTAPQRTAQQRDPVPAGH